MRIATFYPVSFGRNDGAPLYFTIALRNMGHEVIHFTTEDTKDLETYGKFDLYLWVDHGEDGLPIPYKQIEKLPSPSVYIPCDTHITEKGRDYRFNKALNFDYVFFNQKRGMDEYLETHPEKKDTTFWLPCAVEPLAYPNTPVAIKKYDVGFVGFVTFEKRALALDRMFKEFPNFWFGQKLFEEAAEIYRKSRIIFSSAAVDDIQMRTFEGTATGSFLLTEWVPHLDELFEDGKHLVTYKTLDEAVEKAKYYLEHESERETIAKAGMEHTLANHTYEVRAKKILSIVFPDKLATAK